MQFNFKQKYDLKDRKKKYEEQKLKYPNRFPVICEKDPISKPNITNIKSRYLLPFDMTVNQFMLMLRSKLKLNESESFFFLINGKYNVSGNQNLYEIYKKYKDKDDGFLYIIYSNELLWGN